MKQIFSKIETKFEDVIRWFSKFPMVGLFVIKTVTLMIILTVIEHICPLPTPPIVKEYNIATQVLIMVLILPYLETWFFHNYLLKLGVKYTGYKFLSTWLSAIFFGAFHNYSGGYIVATTVSGLFYGTYYFTFLDKSQKPLTRIFILHAANNMISVILNAFS